MKKLITAACLLLSFHVHAQNHLKAKHPFLNAAPGHKWDSASCYDSYMQVEELTHSITNETFYISFNETEGSIRIMDDQQHDPTEFNVEYYNTIIEPDGKARLYKIVSGTSKFKTLKIQKFKKAKEIMGNTYTQALVFSNSDFFGNKTNDFVFMCH